MRILAIGAHPDDWETGACGMLQRGDARYALVATRGERGGDGEVRSTEARASLAVIRADGGMGTQLDTAVIASDFAVCIEQTVRDFRPDLILTMSPNDAHQDHAAVSKATMIAARDWSGTILAYCTPSAAEHFRPNWFVGLTDAEMAVKIRAVACHASQAKRPYLAPSYLEATGRYWAHVTRSSAPFIEPYERPCLKKPFSWSLKGQLRSF